MMQNGRISSPKLRPLLSSSGKPITINMSSCIEVEASIKIKYRHESIMIIFITTTYKDFFIWLLMFKWWSVHKAKSQNWKFLSTCLEIEVSIKIKYGHEGIIIILRTATYIILCHIISDGRVIIQSQYQVWIINFIEN